jgi:hypothetical protein
MAIDFEINRIVKGNPWVYHSGRDLFIVSSLGMVVVSDRDLGAEALNEKWKLFQRWNNYPFANDTSAVTTDANRVDVTDYWPPSTNPNGYYSSDIYRTGNGAWFTNPADPAAHWFTLWWGDAPQLFADISTPAQQIDRQWPCPAWYFIPSTGDFNFLLQVFAEITPNITLTTNANGTITLTGTGLGNIANSLLITSAPYWFRGTTGTYSTATAITRRTCNEYLSNTVSAYAGFSIQSGTYYTLDTDRYTSPTVAFPIRPFKAIEKR